MTQNQKMKIYIYYYLWYVTNLKRSRLNSKRPKMTQPKPLVIQRSQIQSLSESDVGMKQKVDSVLERRNSGKQRKK